LALFGYRKQRVVQKQQPDLQRNGVGATIEVS
jgi:hypothetical protein